MVNMNNDESDLDIETTINENNEIKDTELVDEEEKSSNKIKKIRKKLSLCEDEKKKLQDELQRTRADFLNARKRLEEDRIRDKIRYQKSHIEDLLPLCDSFQMAMDNKEVWEKADKTWRAGIEGIYSQLNRILENYGVTEIDPKGEPFDPHRDEAIGTEEVEDDMVDKVITVVQKGYEMKNGNSTEIIRHTRVTTGIKKHE